VQRGIQHGKENIVIYKDNNIEGGVKLYEYEFPENWISHKIKITATGGHIILPLRYLSIDKSDYEYSFMEVFSNNIYNLNAKINPAYHYVPTELKQLYEIIINAMVGELFGEVAGFLFEFHGYAEAILTELSTQTSTRYMDVSIQIKEPYLGKIGEKIGHMKAITQIPIELDLEAQKYSTPALSSSIYGDMAVDEFFFTQGGYLNISQNYVPLSWKRQSTSVTMKTNYDVWKVDSSERWLTVSLESTNNHNVQLKLNTEEHFGNNKRSAEVTISAYSDDDKNTPALTKTITIDQYAIIVETMMPDGVTANSATLRGSYSNNGDNELFECGFYIRKENEGGLGDKIKTNEYEHYEKSMFNSTSFGDLNLEANTLYSYCAYANLKIGYSQSGLEILGNPVTFKTRGYND
jgi:hypothetical protein